MEVKILWTSTGLYWPLCRKLQGQNPAASHSCISEWRFGSADIPHVAFPAPAAAGCVQGWEEERVRLHQEEFMSEMFETR